MNGEDVYDLARPWCHVCNADHEDCDPADLDLRYTCLKCMTPIEYDDEDDGDSEFHSWCRPTTIAAGSAAPENTT